MQLAGSASYTYNSMHQLTAVSGLDKDATYAYDLDGNQKTKTAGTDVYEFAYTFENRLRVMSVPEEDSANS